MTETPRLEELKRRVQRDPASISFAALAEEYRRLGMFPEAIETCRAGLQRHPSYLSARVTLGRALVEVGDYDEASAELEQVLRSAPENLAAIRALADIHRRRGEVSDADHYNASLNRAAPAAAAPSVPVRIAVQSADVVNNPEPPALVELESFLAAIGRARRDVTVHAAR
jgi:tetratricopeptide (TPR) repeat protein